MSTEIIPPEEKHEKQMPVQKQEYARLVRILETDIPGEKNIYTGLTKIKGVSWSFSNAACNILGINKNKKISGLEKDEIKRIEEFIKNPGLPEFLLNRRKDMETGKSHHLLTSDLSMQKEFDIKRLKKIRTYRGLRHALGQPVRGQRTRSHFRKKGKSVGVGKKMETKPAAGGKK